MHQSIHFNSMHFIVCKLCFNKCDFFYVKDCRDLLPIAKVVHRKLRKVRRKGWMHWADTENK